MKNKPCLDCPDREIGCHSNCDNYQTNRKAYDKSKDEYANYAMDMHTKRMRGGH